MNFNCYEKVILTIYLKLLRELLVKCKVPNAEKYANHDLRTYGINNLANNSQVDGASTELMSHSRHTSLKSQQAYRRNTGKSQEKFQLALSPVPFPKRKDPPKLSTKPVKKARMKAPPKNDLTQPIPKKSSKGDVQATRRSARIQGKKERGGNK